MIKTPHWPVPLGSKPIDLGLERVKKLLERLENPHFRLPPTIHIAGTNGKGSTLAIIKSIVEAAGYKIHRYTSPHLIYFNERIELAGKPIADDVLYAALEACRKQAEGLRITFFEGTTAAAFLAFSQSKADYVLLETGLGGRLDATNVLKQPLLTLITPISFDHMEFLGNSIAEIAAEKAAIMRPNVPCVVAPQLPEVMEVIKIYAAKINAPLHFTEDVTLPCPPALPGEHQTTNAKVAVKAVTLINRHIPSHHIITGLQTVHWPARLQKLILHGKEVWLDGGHNADAGKILAAWTKEHAPITLICGMMKRKDVAAFLTPLKPYIGNLIAVPIPDMPDALPPEEMVKIATSIGIPAMTAKNLSLATCHSPLATTLIAGSLYLAGAALAEAG